MEINSYNLFINKTFDTYNYTNASKYSIFKVEQENLLMHSIYLILQSKPDTNSISETVNLNANINCYLFPTVNSNVTFKVNEILHTADGNSIFLIINNISDNLFTLKLIQSNNGTNYTLYNNTQSLLYNDKLESFQFKQNTNKSLVLEQQNNYTQILSETNKLSDFISSNVDIATDYTSDYTISFNFRNIEDEYLKISNIIDKFYMNIQIYDYNDFKYIYKRDIEENINNTNYSLTNTNKILGILKTSNTKIIPHTSFKLQKEKLYIYTNTIINNYTSHKKQYSGDKLLVLLQLSLQDKSLMYDLNNNIESDSIFIIY